MKKTLTADWPLLGQHVVATTRGKQHDQYVHLVGSAEDRNPRSIACELPSVDPPLTRVRSFGAAGSMGFRKNQNAVASAALTHAVFELELFRQWKLQSPSQW
jgi:hypothetical protein